MIAIVAWVEDPEARHMVARVATALHAELYLPESRSETIRLVRQCAVHVVVADMMDSRGRPSSPLLQRVREIVPAALIVALLPAAYPDAPGVSAALVAAGREADAVVEPGGEGGEAETVLHAVVQHALDRAAHFSVYKGPYIN
jgi:hypothetical protein